jgi:hypothetical protein
VANSIPCRHAGHSIAGLHWAVARWMHAHDAGVVVRGVCKMATDFSQHELSTVACGCSRMLGFAGKVQCRRWLAATAFCTTAQSARKPVPYAPYAGPTLTASTSLLSTGWVSAAAGGGGVRQGALRSHTIQPCAITQNVLHTNVTRTRSHTASRR